MHQTINRLDSEITRLQAQRAAVVADLQCDCVHEMVSECDYQPASTFGNAYPPMRVCERCGLSEEGWGPGFVVLVTVRTRKVSRDEVYRMRAGLRIVDSHKGPLLRGETTMAALVDGLKKKGGAV